MASAVQASNSSTAPPHATPAGQARGRVPGELLRLQKRLLRAAASADEQTVLLATIAGLVREAVNVVMVRHYRRKGGDLVGAWQWVRGSGIPMTESLHTQLLDACKAACGKGQVRVDRLGALPGMIAVSAPVFLQQQPPEALLLLVPETTRQLERALFLLQLAATHLTLWYTFGGARAAMREAEAVAALVELLERLADCEDRRHACQVLACELKEFLGWDHVAVGLCHGRKNACRLWAISGRSEFDRDSERARAIEAAMDEAVLRGSLGQWPSEKGATQAATRALTHLKACCGSQLAVSGPLRDARRGAVGAWVLLADEQDAAADEGLRFLEAAEAPVAACLKLLERGQGGTLARLTHRAAAAGRKPWRIGAAAIAACLAVGALAMPVPYKIKAKCQVQPCVHRFVAAPYEGRLEKASVGPGDVVSREDVLARMDGRDIRWELASLIAEHGRAAKRRDVALAGHDVVTAQLAKLEMEKLELNMEMLEDRAAHLEIKSPIDGIVISGDLERAEGAPLVKGQSLFEIAPLDRVVVEVAVAEDDIRFVREDLPVAVRLEAHPRRVWEGRIARVQPRSENRDDRNVFIAAVFVENGDDALRPGMNGRAEIAAGHHPLAWNLFHKPCERLLSWLGW